MASHPVPFNDVAETVSRRKAPSSHRRFRVRSLSGACVVAVLGATAALGEPYVPRDDAVVVERLPAAVSAMDPELAELRRQLRNNPGDLVLAVHLARRYFSIGRAEGDPRWVGYAEAVLAPWWNLSDPPGSVLTLRAMIRQNRHHFAAALADLDRAVGVNPRDAQGWLSRAVVLQVQGRYDEAIASCRRLFALLSDPLVATACVSDAASLAGESASGYRALHRVARQGNAGDPRVAVWVETILGEIAMRQGSARAAERHFRRALASGERDVQVLAAYADLLLDQDRPAEARALLADEARVDGLLLRLALSEHALGSAGVQEHVRTLADRFAAARARGDKIHLREEARFTLHLLGEPERALRLARENWQVQREPRDARIVLEAALAANAPDKAADVLRWLAATGLEDQAIAPLIDRITRLGHQERGSS